MTLKGKSKKTARSKNQVVNRVFSFVVDHFKLYGIAPYQNYIAKKLGMHNEQVRRILAVLIKDGKLTCFDGLYYLPTNGHYVDNVVIFDEYVRLRKNKVSSPFFVLKALPDSAFVDRVVEVIGELYRRKKTLGDIACDVVERKKTEKSARG